jgi:formylglycine-generating enzyme required for sulfatase activity
MQFLPRAVGFLVILLLSVGATVIEAAEIVEVISQEKVAGQITTDKDRGDAGGVSGTPQQFDREITGKDGAKMLLIPAGEFMMGSADGRDDEEPVHRVRLDAFYLDKYEVTNSLFRSFVNESGYETTAERQGRAAGVTPDGEWDIIPGAKWLRPEGTETVFESNRAEHPVVSVSWYDADAYCRWVKKRLPAEAEFEYASRAGTRTTYWWGDGSPGSRRVADIADESARRRFPGLPIMEGYDDGYERSAPVGSFDPNPWGLYDMIGNVWEWTADWYAEDYYRKSPERNPLGPTSGQYKVLRGGSWHNGPLGVRVAYRRNSQPAYSYDHIGFRCAMTP